MTMFQIIKVLIRPCTILIGVLMGTVWAGGPNCPYPLLGGALAVVVKGLLMGWVMGE